MTNEEQFTQKLESLVKNGFRLCPVDYEEDDSEKDEDDAPVYSHCYPFNF